MIDLFEPEIYKLAFFHPGHRYFDVLNIALECSFTGRRGCMHYLVRVHLFVQPKGSNFMTEVPP